MTFTRLTVSAVSLLTLCACANLGSEAAQPGQSGLDSEATDSPAARSELPDIGQGLPEPKAESENTQPADRDGDQIADAEDQCPDSEPGTAVNPRGCAVFSGAIENLVFAPDDDELNAEARAALDALITDLMEHPDAVIAVDGHTDNRGLASNNLDLSKRRVIAVVRYLVEQGVPASRLKPYGYGESRPLKRNATPEGRRSNRRIEVRQVRA